MRPIPAEITDAAVRKQLTDLGAKIDEKMKKVNVVRARVKKDFSPADISELKTLGNEIDALDEEWREIAGV
jgi:hypothetical protein